jgi:hypothetical protein
VPLPELTATSDGWLWHPADSRPLPLPAGTGTSDVAQLDAAQLDAALHAAAERLLRDLEASGLLQPPRYCAA